MLETKNLTKPDEHTESDKNLQLMSKSSDVWLMKNWGYLIFLRTHTEYIQKIHNLSRGVKFSLMDGGISRILSIAQYLVYLKNFKLRVLSSSFKIWFNMKQRK